MVLIDTSNMDNLLVKQVRDDLITQYGGSFLHGKKRSFSKKSLEMSEKQPGLEKLASILTGNVMLYFHDASCAAVVKAIEKYEKYGVAKYGRPSPIDFTITPQITKLSPDTTKYFQKLRVPTKLTKGTIEITNFFRILEAGKPVNQNQIDILALLKIKPIKYNFTVTGVYTSGQIVDPEVFKINIDQITQSVVQQATSLAHGVSMPCKPVASASNSNVLQDVFALALELADKIEAPAIFKDKIALLNDPEALEKMKSAAAAVTPAVQETKAEEAKVEEPVAESESASELDMDF